MSLEQRGPGRQVRVLSNTRQRGLAGNRNTGILAAASDLIAFLDDDDTWLPGKLTRQVSALLSEPTAQFATTAMEVAYDGGLHERRAGVDRVRHRDLLRSRMAMLHSSSFLVWRDALVDEIGLVTSPCHTAWRRTGSCSFARRATSRSSTSTSRW